MQACRAHLFIQVLVLRSAVTCDVSEVSCQSQDMRQLMHVKPGCTFQHLRWRLLAAHLDHWLHGIVFCAGEPEMIQKLCYSAAFGVEEALARTDGETEYASSSYSYGTRSACCLKPASPIRTDNGLCLRRLRVQVLDSSELSTGCVQLGALQ